MGGKRLVPGDQGYPDRGSGLALEVIGTRPTRTPVSALPRAALVVDGDAPTNGGPRLAVCSLARSGRAGPVEDRCAAVEILESHPASGDPVVRAVDAEAIAVADRPVTNDQTPNPAA